MPSRRAILGGLGMAAFAGCMGPEAGSGPPGDAAAPGDGPAGNASSNATTGDTDAAGEGEAASDEQTDGSAAEPALDARGPVRAEADVVPSIRSVEGEDDDGENTTLTDDGAVRFVAGWRHTNHEEVRAGEPPEREPFYESTEWEEWAETQARLAAAQKAAEHARDQLGVEDGISGGSSSTVVEDGWAAVVSTSTTLDRDGEVVYELPVAFDELVAATPRSVEVTYVLEDREYETTESIYVRHSVVQQE